jgi:hypothetical protein
MEDAAVRTDSKNAIDRAFADIQPILFKGHFSSSTLGRTR